MHFSESSRSPSWMIHPQLSRHGCDVEHTPVGCSSEVEWNEAERRIGGNVKVRYGERGREIPVHRWLRPQDTYTSSVHITTSRYMSMYIRWLEQLATAGGNWPAQTALWGYPSGKRCD